MNKGFTLIELLVSMAIIGVLTGMAVFNFNQSRVRARDVQRKNDVDQLQKALEVYKLDHNAYPSTDLQTTLLSNGYIKKSFNDPKGPDEWADYTYVYVDYKSYYLATCLENPADTTKSSSSVCTSAGFASCACGGSEKTGVLYTLSQP